MRLSLFCLLFTLLSSCSVSRAQDVSKKAAKKYEEGLSAIRMGDVKLAQDMFLEAIEISPTYGKAHAQLAQLYDRTLQPAMAMNHYRKAGRYSADGEPYHYRLGQLFYLQMAYDSASFYAEKVGSEPGDELRASIAFAREAVKNPVPFTPEPCGPAINSANGEYFPSLTVDGKQLFFSRVRNVNGYAVEEIYTSTKKDGEWTTAKRVPKPINLEGGRNGAHSISADGRYIFFASDRRENNYGRFDLYFAKKADEGWGQVRNLGPKVNGRKWDSQVFITADERALFFVSDRAGGYGGADIYVSYLTQNGFGEAINLGPTINTSGDEARPQLHPDGKTLYFSSTGHLGMGQGDVFVATASDDSYTQWTDVKNLGYPINTAGHESGIFVEADGRFAYMSSDREGGMGKEDLYRFAIPESAQPKSVTYVSAQVIDAVTEEPVVATVALQDIANQENSRKVETDSRGRFLLPLPSGTTYSSQVFHTGYAPYSSHFDVRATSENTPYELVIPLEPLGQANRIVLNNIFFDTDSYVLLPESFSELDVVVSFLKENASLQIEIEGHTDDRGDNAHNLELSKNRAQAVYDYLVTQGIDAARLKAVGYGETKPRVPNDSPENRAKNRRTELKIIQ